MHGQRFSLPEDIVGIFKNHVLELSQSEWKTNTNDDRTSKHYKQSYVRKCQTLLWKYQISAGKPRNIPGQKYAGSKIFVVTYVCNALK